MKVLLANPRGFCAGVDRAIAIVERALERFGPPIYVRHEVVHNRYVVDGLRGRGVVFVQELDEVPDGATVIFSAHGVPRSVHEAAEARWLTVLDATCPLVTKVHLEAVRHHREGRECILIGHAGHPEVVGTMGQVGPESPPMHLVERPADVDLLQVNDPDNLAYVTQTTLSVDDTNAVIAALRARYPAIQGPRKDDICYATQNRQDALRALADRCELVLVVGSANSSNSNRLAELARKNGTPAELIDSPALLRREWFQGVHTVGVTAGASAPEVLVRQVLDRLREWGASEIAELDGIEENVRFPLPPALR